MARYALRSAYAFSSYRSPYLKLWPSGYPLRGVGPGGIPVAATDGLGLAEATHYTIDIKDFIDQLHPDLDATPLWGFHPSNALGGGTQLQKHLGGIIVAQRGEKVQVTFRNYLPPDHIIPIDRSVPGDWYASGIPTLNNRIAVHLHGGFVPWISDGGPFDWWTPDGAHGQSFLNNETLNPAAVTGSADYYYPNDQSARLLWYHDHAFGMDRNSAYAGVATAYLIRDPYELGLKDDGLPEFIENSVLGKTPIREIPIVIQDKTFVDADTIDTLDPTWPGPRSHGSLWYAHLYDTAIFGPLGPAPQGPPGDPSCVPEFFGDTMLANGTVYPEISVEPRRYRLRILNACNSRFVNLQLYVDDGSANGITLDRQGIPVNLPALNAAAKTQNKLKNPTPNFLVIGSEGGLLPRADYVPLNVPFIGSLLLAPAERSDVIFDFSAHAGQRIILYNDAPAPFPGGAPMTDYFPGLNNRNPVNATTPPGYGPNTRVIMRFNVGTLKTGNPDLPLQIPRWKDLSGGNDPLLVPVGVATPPPGVTTTRQLTLNEAFDEHGRLAQLLGTNQIQPDGGYGMNYLAPPTETPRVNDIEVWQIANLSADTHPIHFHLVNVQILSRQPFNGYKGGVANLSGAPILPAPHETGWKETVRMNPGEVTTVIMQFKLPDVPFTVPSTRRWASGGHEYVWHCHILEHEEHDMMRPLVVT